MKKRILAVVLTAAAMLSLMYSTHRSSSRKILIWYVSDAGSFLEVSTWHGTSPLICH